MSVTDVKALVQLVNEIDNIIKEKFGKCKMIGRRITNLRDKKNYYKKVGLILQDMVHRYERTLDKFPPARVIHDNT